MSRRHPRSAAHRVALLVAWVLVAVGCSASTLELPQGITVADGFTLELVATGFDRPTQMTRTPAGDIIVAEIAGAENDAQGRLILVDGDDFDRRTTLATALDKPTGVAVIGDALWVMQRDSLWVGRFDGETSVELVAVLEDLPSNGRSQGTLTVTPDQGLLFDTSGSKRGRERVDGSATLFVIERPTLSPSEPQPVATGFKHAYAHTYTGDGQLWSVEMTDGTFDGQRASDELVRIVAGDDAGWPYCVDDNRPVIEFGGDNARCVGAPRSHALFGPGTTPTSLAAPPWARSGGGVTEGQLLATLWLSGRVVAVPTDPSEAPYVGTTVIDGIESPQSLLVDGEAVLIADHESGGLFALTKQ